MKRFELGQAVAVALAATGLGFATAPASAETLISTNTCLNSDVTGLLGGGQQSSDDCFGFATASPVNLDTFNENFFSEDGGLTEIEGLFGITEWTLSAKEDVNEAPNPGADIGFELTFTNGLKEGTWSVDDGVFDDHDAIAIILKGSNGFSAYYFDGTVLPTSGTWDTRAIQNNQGNPQDLSNFQVLSWTEIPDPGPPPGTVPLPPSILLLMGGLTGLVVLRKRARI